MSHQIPNNINLREPTPADVSKLHSEINQYINQRLTVTTTAITIFGVFTGWMVTQNTGNNDFPIYIALLAILAALFLYCQVILWQIRILASYLRVTRQSIWEYAYREYHKKNKKKTLYLDQDNLFKWIFIGLGLINSFVIVFLGKFSLPFLGSLIAYILFIVFIDRAYENGKNERIDEIWVELFNGISESPDSTSESSAWSRLIKFLVKKRKISFFLSSLPRDERNQKRI